MGDGAQFGSLPTPGTLLKLCFFLLGFYFLSRSIIRDLAGLDLTFDSAPNILYVLKSV